MSADTPRRLGRGLEAIISTAKQQRDTGSNPVQAAPPPGSELQRIPVADIAPNRFQPRRTFTEPELAELEASIRSSGLLQPIVVRTRGDGKWELVAGERRLRAVGRLGWTDIPAVVRDFDDRAMLTLALVENLQRADLNPLEEAEGYQRLVDEFALTQQQVADIVGKDRTTVANTLRILHLPASVRRMLADGQLSAGHARALLSFGNEHAITELAREVAKEGLSVREVERRAREQKSDHTAATTTTRSRDLPAEARRIEEELRRRLQTDVQIALSAKEKGTIRIPFYSADDLERVLDLILGAYRDDTL
jgi:ParB family transcriptional regulator, chromosome partitioning protein